MSLFDTFKSTLASLDGSTNVRIQLGTDGSIFVFTATDLISALGIQPTKQTQKKVRVISPFLRIRSQPTTSSTEITRFNQGDVFAIIDAPPIQADSFNWARTADGRGWIALEYTQAAELPFTPTPVPQPIAPVSPTWTLPFTANQRGVGTSAGGWAPSPQELNLIRQNHIEFVLICCYEGGQAIKAIPSLRDAGVKAFILRATIHEPVTTAERFLAITLPLLREYVTAIGNGQTIMIAVHNEPNLVQEGWTKAWQDGAGFGSWFQVVATEYRRQFGSAKIGFPALSPGGDVPGVRLSETTFMAGAAVAIQSADWAAIHYYWQKPDGSDIAPPVAQWRSWFGNLPIIATEVGPTDANTVTPEAMRLAYQRFATLGVPASGWVLSGAGAWQNAAWDLHNLTL